MGKVSYFILASYGITLLGWTWTTIATSVVWRNIVLYTFPLWVASIWVLCMSKNSTESNILVIPIVLFVTSCAGFGVMILTELKFRIAYDISYTWFNCKLPFIPMYLWFVAITGLASSFLLNSIATGRISSKKPVAELLETMAVLFWLFSVFKIVNRFVPIESSLSAIPFYTSCIFIIPGYLPLRDYLVFRGYKRGIAAFIFGSIGFSVRELVDWGLDFPLNHPLLWVVFICYFLVALVSVVGRLLSKPMHHAIDLRRAVYFVVGLVCLAIWTILNWFTVAYVYV